MLIDPIFVGCEKAFQRGEKNLPKFKKGDIVHCFKTKKQEIVKKVVIDNGAYYYVTASGHYTSKELQNT